MRTNIHRSLLAPFAVLSSVALWTPLSAAAEPEGGCPPPFELMTVEETVALARPEFESDIRRADRNDDGYLCVKFAKNTPAFTYIDNRVQAGGRP